MCEGRELTHCLESPEWPKDMRGVSVFLGEKIQSRRRSALGCSHRVLNSKGGGDNILTVI